MNPRRSVLLLPFLMALAVTPLAGQTTDTVRVAVAPQVELFTLVHRPAGDGPHPVVLVRTPYRTRGGSTGWLAERLVPHGYAVVEQDVRGTGGSDGAFVPFAFDVDDGTATLDWLAGQPWAGPVGLWGISYLGWAAYALAETGHPAISAMVVGSAWADMEPFLNPGGAFHLQAHLAWLMGFAGGGGVPDPEAFERIARSLPLRPLLARAEPVLALAQRPYRWEAVRVPALHFTGWNDYLYRESLRGYERLRHHGAAGEGQRLIVGAWSHNGEMSGERRVADVDYGPAAAAGIDSVAAWSRRFFDARLRGLPEVDPPVRVFVMGENGWRSFADWPPANAVTARWYLAGDGRLETRAGRRAGETLFDYDPHDPAPTLGGVNSHLFPANLGPLDQRPLDGRSDVARFVSAPLRRPVILAGSVRAVLYLQADAPSTDVAVKLVTVAPDGTARVVEEGIRRIPRLERGVTEVTVDLGQRALRLEPGYRLRVDVTGGSFPKYDRNPNTGEAAIDATELRPVQITLRHGRPHPSRLEAVTLPE
jgi:uncharacterized protein